MYIFSGLGQRTDAYREDWYTDIPVVGPFKKTLF
jgi:hypothetical protein